MRRNFYLLGLGLALLASGCVDPSASGFKLPPGDPVRGRAAFVELQCTSCHTVGKLDLPAPVADPRVGVDLGVVLRRRSNGEMVTSIINPSHSLLPSRTGGITEVAGASRMADYGHLMTTQQLTDVVAFLQAHQQVQRPLSRF